MPADTFKASRESIVEEAIPAAIKVKEEILNVRTEAIKTLADIVYRQRYKQDISKELSTFQANVAALYMLLREKFPATHKVRTLDGVITGNKDLGFKELYGHFCALNHKIEELKITKIEIKKIPEGESLA